MSLRMSQTSHPDFQEKASNDDFKDEKTFCYVPRRFILISLVVLLICVCYFIRVLLSVAILPLSTEYDWPAEIQGLMLSSFYWGYIVTQIPGGLLAKRFGGKIVFGVGMFVAALFTGLLPFVASNRSLFILFRVLTGLGEGVTFPSLYTLYGEWLPKSEKTILITIANASSYLGTILAMLLSPIIINNLGWTWLFYGTGIIGAVCLVPWFLFVKSIPEDPNSWALLNPSEAETHYIVTTRDKALIVVDEDDESEGLVNQNTSPSVPWFTIMTSPAFLVLIYNHFASNWGFYIFLSWLPTYLKLVLGFDIKSGKNIWSMVPYIGAVVVTISSGIIASLLIEKNIMRTLNVRLLFQSLGTFVPSCCLIILACVQLDSYSTLALMISAISSAGFSNAGLQCNYADISGKYSGAMFSVTNTFATIPGIAGVYITGYILEQTNYDWKIIFLLAAAINMVGCIVFVIWAKGEQINFDEMERKRKPFLELYCVAPFYRCFRRMTGSDRSNIQEDAHSFIH